MPKTTATTRVPSRITLLASDGDFTIEAADGEKKLRRFSMLAYTGGLLRVEAFFRPVVVDLQGLTVSAKSRPILRQHDPNRIIGHSDNVAIVGSNVRVTGVLSAATNDAREVAESADNGFPWRASIGASVQRMVSVDDGEKVVVNGRTFTGPIFVARKARLGEISFVALGADDNTSAKIAASAASLNVEAITMQFDEWLKANNHDADNLDDAQRDELQAKFDVEMAAAKPPALPKKVDADPGDDTDNPVDDPGDFTIKCIRAAVVKEKKRIAAIEKICEGNHADIEAKAIEEGWDETRTELEVIRAERPQGPAIHSEDSQHKSSDVIEAALCMNAGGMSEEQVGGQYSDQTMEAALSTRYRTFTLHVLMDSCIRATGAPFSGSFKSNAFIESAFAADKTIRASGFTTVSLSGILSNVANKSMLAAYNSVNRIAHRLATIANHSDFKQHTKYRLTGTGDFQQVAPTGELKHAGYGEDSHTNQVDTYGQLITLNRQMMINDDLGAFLQIPRIIGRKGALSVEKAFWTLVLANANNFFHADNKNYFEGASSALDVDSLTTAEQKFLDQVDSDGDPILLLPRFLVSGTALKVPAESLMKEKLVNETTTANKKSTRDNPHAGKFEPLSTPYLNSQGISGGSAVQWYLWGDPADVAAIEIAYLNGRSVPVIESGQADFDVLGMRWRGYFDYGISQQDPKGAVKSKGAA